MKARQAKGWTQQELATKMSAKVSVVQEYENGKCVPQPQVIQQLQRALGVQVCDTAVCCFARFPLSFKYSTPCESEFSRQNFCPRIFSNSAAQDR